MYCILYVVGDTPFGHFLNSKVRGSLAESVFVVKQRIQSFIEGNAALRQELCRRLGVPIERQLSALIPS